jgi:tetratricopeptide repeat protein
VGVARRSRRRRVRRRDRRSRRRVGAGSDDLDDAVRAFLALTSLGRDREAVSLALTALAAHLPRYNRSLAAYARELA